MASKFVRKNAAVAIRSADPLANIGENQRRKTEHFLSKRLGHAPTLQEMRDFLRERARA
jgi:hypothetical protein